MRQLASRTLQEFKWFTILYVIKRYIICIHSVYTFKLNSIFSSSSSRPSIFYFIYDKVQKKWMMSPILIHNGETWLNPQHIEVPGDEIGTTLHLLSTASVVSPNSSLTVLF